MFLVWVIFKMKKKKSKAQSERVSINFESQHLPVLVAALETYSRLLTGQVKIAVDTVYSDRHISYEEAQFIENAVRYVAFPQSPERRYDGHGGFYDQYNNEYDEGGSIVRESPLWKNKKNNPHLEYANSYFGVGCREAHNGTVAFEIRKVIDQYLHYKENDGYRVVNLVSGDGVRGTGYSGIPVPYVEGFKPELRFCIPKRNQAQVEKLFQNQKDWDKLWSYIKNTAFKNKPLPTGSCSRLQKIDNLWYVVVEEPYKLNS